MCPPLVQGAGIRLRVRRRMPRMIVAAAIVEGVPVGVAPTARGNSKRHAAEALCANAEHGEFPGVIVRDAAGEVPAHIPNRGRP